MNQSLSTIISNLRFPLAILIVFKHYYTPDISSELILGKEEYSFYMLIGQFTSGVIPAIAVPLFFFISGYLYFIKINIEEGFKITDYKQKTLNRIKSLLIPYISWNLIILILFSSVQLLLSNENSIMDKEGYKYIGDYKIIDFCKAMYALDSTGMPIDGPLWFIRDLFIISILSPLVYFIAKYLKWIGVLLLGLCYLCGNNLIPIPGFSIGCIFFFTWGTLMGLNKRNLLVNISNKWAKIFITIIIILLILFTLSDFYGINEIFFKNIYIIGTVILIFGAMSIFYRKGLLNISTFLTNSSFFIFAIHKPIQVIFRRTVFKIFEPESDFICSLLVILIPILTIIFSLTCFYIIKKHLPFLKFLNGYRL